MRTQKAIKIGNSVGAVIPADIRDEIDIQAGTPLEVITDLQQEAITFRKKSLPALKLSDAPTKLTPEFHEWLQDFNHQYASTLKQLAQT